MAQPKPPEVWLRGPLPAIPPLLQPIAHALLQAQEEVQELTHDFPEAYLWYRPAGVASVGFHLQHLTGVLNRLFTYARGEALTEDQLQALRQEGQYPITEGSIQDFISAFQQQVQLALEQLSNTSELTLTEPRLVGRAKLPSTVIGLLVHAAEHTMRHVGQLLVTVRILKEQGKA